MADAHDKQLAIVGRNPVREAIQRRDGRIEKVWLQKGGKGRGLDEIRGIAERAGIQVQYVPANRLNEIADGATHQGAAALLSATTYRNIDDMLAEIAATRQDVETLKPVLVLLDQIEDPHNFGAIIRSAVAFGAAGIIVPQHGMAPLSAVAVKSSAGTALRIPITQVTNLAETISQLKERGYWVAGLDGIGDTSVWEMDWDRALAVVIGSEGKGIRPRVLSVCDYVVAIPMSGDAESLNASVAAGIVLAAARGRT